MAGRYTGMPVNFESGSKLGERQLARFMRRVNKTESCWEWMGARIASGYGRVILDSHAYLCHRVSYSHFNGPIPSGMIVRHSCDNPCCVNPAHLLIGTYADNGKDKSDRGRQPKGVLAKAHRGEKNHMARLTREQVEEIKRVYIPYHSEFGGAALGRRYGITRMEVNHIVRGNRWDPVLNPPRKHVACP
jgi:hypothetical protein